MRKEYPLDIKTYRFPIRVPVQMRFIDIDGFGHVNNSAQQAFFDLGRAAYLQKVCGPEFYKDEKSVVIVSYTTDFIDQIRLTDEVEVRAAVYAIGNKSLKMLLAIVDTKNDRVCCVCDSVMAGFDQKNQCGTAILPEWREKIAALEGREL